MNFKFSIKLAIVSLIGNLIMGIGVAIVRIAHFGIDPFSSMIAGCSAKIGIGIGSFQSIFNIILFIVLVLIDHKNIKYLNIGAIFNMFLLGYVIQLCNGLICNLFCVSSPDEVLLRLPIRFMCLVLGILVITLGCSLYIQRDLGTAPYDSRALFMQEKFQMKYSICRIVTDVISFAVALIAGGPVGFSTVIFMTCMGPFVSMWDNAVSKKLINNINK